MTLELLRDYKSKKKKYRNSHINLTTSRTMTILWEMISYLIIEVGILSRRRS